MSIKPDIVARLVSLGTPAGDRVSFVQSPQRDGRPRIVITQIDGEHQHHMLAATGIVIGRFQMDMYATSTLAAISLAESVRMGMDGFRGMMGGTEVQMCHLSDERDTVVPPTDGSDAPVYGVQHDYLVGWVVPVPTFE